MKKKQLIVIWVIIIILSLRSYAEEINPSQEVINRLYAGARQLKNDGRYTEAENIFKRILTIQPHNSNAHFDLGNVYLFQNKIEDALKHYKEAKEIGLDRQYMADYYFNLSMCYAKIGNNKKAINSIKQCLKINPEYPEAENLLGLYKDGGKIEIEPVE